MTLGAHYYVFHRLYVDLRGQGTGNGGSEKMATQNDGYAAMAVVRWTSVGRLTDVRWTSDGRLTTSDRRLTRPSDVRQTSACWTCDV